jgi:beta-lactam-binding protein with PASTA domain
MTNLEPIIIKCEIGPFPRPMPEGMFDQMPSVNVTLSNGESLKLFEYYPDEISFVESEFIGLTVAEAENLLTQKDVKYIQS